MPYQHGRSAPPFVAGFCIVVFLAMIVWLGIVGYQTHQAVCTLRGDLISRTQSSERFLHLSDTERVREYGKIGKIPASTIQAQIHQQQRTIKALDTAHCDSFWGVFFS